MDIIIPSIFCPTSSISGTKTPYSLSHCLPERVMLHHIEGFGEINETSKDLLFHF